MADKFVGDQLELDFISPNAKYCENSEADPNELELTNSSILYDLRAYCADKIDHERRARALGILERAGLIKNVTN